MSRYTNASPTGPIGVMLFMAVLAILTAGFFGGFEKPPTLGKIVQSRVVVVEAWAGHGTMGTGFLIAPDIVLTAGHVAGALQLPASPAFSAQVYNYDGNIAKIDTVWTGEPGGTDIGLLFLADPLPGVAAPFPTNCETDELTYTTELTMVGAHTQVFGFLTLRAFVMGLYEDYFEIPGPAGEPFVMENYVTIQANGIAGMSGSAVLNKALELVGVVVRKAPNGSYMHMTAGPIVCSVIAEATDLRDLNNSTAPVDAAN